MLQFGANAEMSKVRGLTDELFQNVLCDEEPFFISDGATLWGVSMSDPDEILDRCSRYYEVPVSLEDTREPLWKLLRALDERRKAAKLFPKARRL